MIKLKKLLAESSKVKRRRKIYVSMHITILAWLCEFLGFFLGFVATMIVGHQNNANRAIQVISGYVYFFFVPCTYLINDSEFKEEILKNHLYVRFIEFFEKKIPSFSRTQVVPIEVNN